MSRFALAPLIALFVPAVAGCFGPAPTPEEPVGVRLDSYTFEVERDTFVAGRPYRFVLENAATIPHEWVVVPHGATDEEASLIEVEEDELPPGASRTVTFAFPEPGRYDFACYMTEPASHYAAGMVYSVTVVPAGPSR